MVKQPFSNFRTITAIFLGVRICRIFTVNIVSDCLICRVVLSAICIFWTHYSMVEPNFCSNFRIITAIFFRVSEFLGILR